jgi:hypothetical protein
MKLKVIDGAAVLVRDDGQQVRLTANGAHFMVGWLMSVAQQSRLVKEEIEDCAQHLTEKHPEDMEVVK